MSDESDKFLDIATEDLVQELISRHDSFIYAGFPKGQKKSVLSMRITGSYVTCRGLVLELGDYVRENRPAAINPPEASNG